MFHPHNQTKYESEKLFEINGYTAQLCSTQWSKNLAYALRYRSYVNAGTISKNEEELFYDAYDLQANTRVHLVWYEGQPVASVRSSIWSPNYSWKGTEGINSFWQDTHRKIGLENYILESSRYAVAPEVKGRKSLFAQMLLFRIQDLCSQVESCQYIITAVRQRHMAFYERMLAFKKISGPINYDWLDDEIVLLAAEQEHSRRVVSEKGMPQCSDLEVERYKELSNKMEKAVNGAESY